MSHAHAHGHGHGHGHGPHSHGLVDDSIKRSRQGLRAVGLSLLVLGLTTVAQLLVYLLTDSIALLADLIHNAGDAATAIPLGVAFLLRSPRAERIAGLFVVLAIFVSACVAGYEAIARLLDPREPEVLGALAAAGALGFIGNWIAALIRTRAGHRLDSPALIADGAHARADAYVKPGRHRQRRRRRHRPPHCRPVHRPHDHARDPSHHLAVLAHSAIRRARLKTRAQRRRIRAVTPFG